MTADAQGGAVKIALVSGGVSDPSSTRLLADRITSKVTQVLRADGYDPAVSVIELAPLARDIADAMVGGLRSQRLEEAIGLLDGAELVVASTPVYKAGISGLFKSFADLLDNDVLIGKTVVLAATAGTARHAMVGEDQLRQLFAFFRAISVPTSIFAAPEDWNDPALTARIERAATEAAVLQASGATLRARTWRGHKHEFAAGGSATHEAGDEAVDFDTDLMRLAAGGGAPPS